MKSASYKGRTLTPSSYQDSDLPGHWFPLVVVSGVDLMEPTHVPLLPVRGIDESKANEQAMQVAMQRIQRNNL